MYFEGCTTVHTAKREYRHLAKRYHPDAGGTNEEMKAVNAAYEALLASMDGQEQRGSDGRMHTYHYNADLEREIMDMIQSLLKLRMVDVDIALIGTWIWVKDETKPYKDQLGNDGLGLRWSGKHKAWYWRKQAWRGRTSGKDLGGIAQTYGVKWFEQKDDAVTA